MPMVLALVQRQQKAHSRRAEILRLIDDDTVEPRAGASFCESERFAAQVRPVQCTFASKAFAVLAVCSEHTLAIGATQRTATAPPPEREVVVKVVDSAA